jgi:hypothetical protein
LEPAVQQQQQQIQQLKADLHDANVAWQQQRANTTASTTTSTSTTSNSTASNSNNSTASPPPARIPLAPAMEALASQVDVPTGFLEYCNLLFIGGDPGAARAVYLFNTIHGRTSH